MKNKKPTDQKISDDRKFIVDRYIEMLSRINEDEIISLIINASHQVTAKEAKVSSEKIIQSLSIYFQLLTLVEENAATQYRRKMEDLETITSIRGSWAEALKIWKDELLHLVKKLSISAIINPVPLILTQAIEKKVNALGELGIKAVKRNPHEPWRQFVNLILLQTENTISEKFADSGAYYKSSRFLEDDLKFLRNVLIESGFINEIAWFNKRLVMWIEKHRVSLDDLSSKNTSYTRYL